MEIPRSVAKAVFESNNVKSFYHANSVISACSFLKEGALLSRGSVERKKLFQTIQKTDALDRKLGIWFDVFVDSVDIHHRAKKANEYGPVLFELDAMSLLKENVGKLWISKINPMYWEDKKRSERWFQSSKELRGNFVKGTFGHMIIFRHSGGELPLKKHLKKIILDEPELIYKDGTDFYSQAYGALKASMRFGGLNVPISKRKCQTECSCMEKKYFEGSTFAESMFNLDI